jgi:hypothetical protein
MNTLTLIWLVEPDEDRDRFLVKYWNDCRWTPVDFFSTADEALLFAENPSAPAVAIA